MTIIKITEIYIVILKTKDINEIFHARNNFKLQAKNV